MAQKIEPRPDNSIARFNHWLEDQTKAHLPWFWRFNEWFSTQLRQTDRKTFYLYTWALIAVAVIALVISLT